MLVGESTMLL
jgi:hypothetical protein